MNDRDMCILRLHEDYESQNYGPVIFIGPGRVQQERFTGYIDCLKFRTTLGVIKYITHDELQYFLKYDQCATSEKHEDINEEVGC